MYRRTVMSLIGVIFKVWRKFIARLRGRFIGFIVGGRGPALAYRGVIVEAAHVEFGTGVILYPGVHIFGGGHVKIGDNVAIGDGTVICTGSCITIGADTMVAGQCYIIDCNHGMHLGEPMRRQPMSLKEIQVGKDCWIGAGCKLLPGADIPSGTVVGAGEVVRGGFDPLTINWSKTTFVSKARV